MTSSTADLRADLTALRSHVVALLAHLDRIVAAMPDASVSSNDPYVVDIKGLPRTEAIERVLQAAGRGLGPVEIWAELQAAGRMADPKMEVQVTTYDLWRRGRVEKLGRGSYCHPSHVPAGAELIERPTQP